MCAAMDLPAKAAAQAGGQTDAKGILCKSEAHDGPQCLPVGRRVSRAMIMLGTAIMIIGWISALLHSDSSGKNDNRNRAFIYSFNRLPSFNSWME